MFGGKAIYMELNAAGGVCTAGISETVMSWNLPGALHGTIDGLTDSSTLQRVASALA
jgi:choline/glycine/proline betaine transport protein